MSDILEVFLADSQAFCGPWMRWNFNFEFLIAYFYIFIYSVKDVYNYFVDIKDALSPLAPNLLFSFKSIFT